MPNDSDQDFRVDPRTVMAAERTLLAWVRTGLAMMGFGFVVAKFGLFLRELVSPAQRHQSGTFSLWAGTALVLCGVAATALGTWNHTQILALLEKGTDLTSRRSPATLLSWALGMAGLGLAVYLIVMR